MATPINDRDIELQATVPRLNYIDGNTLSVVASNTGFVRKAGGYVPSSIVLTAYTSGSLRGTVTWPAGVGTANGNTLTITPADVTGTSLSITASLTYLGLPYTASTTITKTEEFASIALTADTVTVTTNSDGSAGAGAYAGAATTASVKIGETDDTTNWTFTWSAAPAGVTRTLSNSNRTIKVDSMANDVDSVQFTVTATKSGWSTLRKTFTVTKSKQGYVGNDSVTVELDSDADVIAADEFGLAYTLPQTQNYLRLYVGSVQQTTGITFGGSALKNGLNLVINAVTGQITLSGTNWTTSTESFALTATYGGQTYTKTYTISKSNRGNSAVFADLATETDIVPATQTGTGYSLPTGNQLFLYRGGVVVTTGVTYSGGGTKNGLTASIDAAGLITLTGAAWTSDSETFTFTATLGGVNYSANYRITKAKQGNSAITTYLSASVPVIAKSESGVMTPSTVTYSAFSRQGNETATAYSGRFKIYVNGSATPSYTSAVNETSTSFSVGNTVTSVLCELYAAGGTITLLDTLGTTVVTDGTSGISVVLSNSSHVFPADNAGAVLSYVNSGTEVRVYQGSKLLTYDGVGTANGTWRVTTTPTNITVGTLTDSGSFLTVGQHSGVAAGTDTSKITYTITGKDLNGNNISTNVDQTFTKSKAGAQGIAGLRTASGYLYIAVTKGSATPTKPTSATYTFSTGAVSGITGGTAGWTQSITFNAANDNYAVYYTVTESAAGSGTGTVSFPGTVTTHTNFSGVVTFTDLSATSGATIIHGSRIDTRGLEIKDANGNVIFSSGTNLSVSRISGLGSLATQNSVSTNQVSGLGSLATQNFVTVGSTVRFPDGTVMNTGDFVNRLSKISSNNISTFMESAAIGSAYIGNAAVNTLKIAGNAVTASSTAHLSIPSGTGTTRYSNIASYTAPADTAITVLIVMSGRTGTTAGSLENRRQLLLQMTSANNTSTGVEVLIDMGASMWYGDYISASKLVTINAGVTKYFHVKLENPGGNTCTLSANLNFFAAKR